MAYHAPPADRAAQLRRYADIIGKTVTPMGASVAPYSNPNLWRAAQGVAAAAFQGAATRAAAREDERKRLAGGNLARLLTGGQPIDVSLPKPTGILAGMDRFLLGDKENIADDGSAIQVLPIGPDGTLNMSALIGQSVTAGLDPVATAGSALQFETSKRAVTAQQLATERANNLREATGLYWTIKKAGDAADPEMVARFNELSVNLPAALPPVEYEQRNVAGKTALIPVNILGQIAGKPTFAPAPVVEYGVKKSAELRADIEIRGTPGQRKVDEAFGTALGKLRASGDLADVEANKAKIQSVVGRLRAIAEGKSDENLTGMLIGAAADKARPGLAFFNSEALNVLEIVEEVVQRNLRVILGAQFTQEEGKRLIARAYNPYLSEELNLVRLERLVNQMSRQLDYKLAAIRYFDENNGTLRGFDGTVVKTPGDAASITDSLIASMEEVGEVPIEKWSVSYIDSFIRPDGKVTQEWHELIGDKEKRARIEKRMRQLGIIKD
jgi:hypothetical protein